VISKIEGGDLAHEIVAVGCHMDAWVMGASDPLSGQAVMIELARVMGLMHAAGWSPRRSIHFLAWDGEEYNLLGSTDYVDKKGDMITKRMVAYVNIDGIVGNWFPDKVALSLSASPVLADVFLDAVSKTPSPVNASQMVSSVFDGTFSVLGDGSDYCSFINHLGVASLDINWGSPNLPSPQYHSRYDSFFLMNNITDPQFAVHKSSVTLVGLIMYHLSTDAALHLSPSFAAAQYASYKTSIVAQFPILSRLDWAGFDSALAEFNVAASAAQALVNSSDPAVNSVLWTLDRQFLTESGLPGRKYFRHVMQAPDLLNDYNSQVLPGVAYYAAANDLPNAQVQLKVVEELLTKAGQGITAVVPVSNAVTIAVIVVAVAFFVAIVIIVILYLRRRSLAHRRYTELPEHK
jgi:N-acetylated-alpha-linked acidic dipeptidase